ncbi:MAG: 23S rRNA (pseudouridine(1915)-N(3))-methyltransferase RlmH, partial [Peptococcaceae bacterium]|nr:23S rRNA (pseudouridine(1915)-N(3))-methyltransferase RlmH [Peptococcaceae bacterium]
MQCRILAVGSIKEAYFTAGINEYLKRLRPVFPVTVHEVKDLPAPNNASAAQIAQLVEQEGQKLLAQLSPDALVVALAIKGRQLLFAESRQRCLDALIDSAGSEATAERHH